MLLMYEIWFIHTVLVKFYYEKGSVYNGQYKNSSGFQSNRLPLRTKTLHKDTQLEFNNNTAIIFIQCYQ